MAEKKQYPSYVHQIDKDLLALVGEDERVDFVSKELRDGMNKFFKFIKQNKFEMNKDIQIEIKFIKELSK